jgi:hypothetical protein
MRTEIEVRDLYKQYVYRYAVSHLDNKEKDKDKFFGASFALGRVLNKDMKKINKDYEVAIAFIERIRSEGGDLPGFREV